MRIMLKKTPQWALCLLILLLAATPGFAQKKGKGGNGGGGNEDPPTPPPVTYDITMISQSLGTGLTFQDMNEDGDFVGLFYDTNENVKGFLYTDELGMIDVNDLLPEGSQWTLRSAKAINNQGTFVGAWRLPGDTVSRAYRLKQNTDGTVTIDDIGKLHPDDYMITSDINDLGEITGICNSHDGTKFIWHYSDATGLKKVDLGVAFGNLYQPEAITNLGVIVGKLATDTNTVYKVVPGSTPELIQSPIHSAPYYLRGVNDFGEFVGQTLFPGKGRKTYWGAYLHDGSLFQEITSEGESPRAIDINNLGDIIGGRANKFREFVPDAKQAFVYLNASQTLVDLDDAVTGTEADMDLWFSDTPNLLKINDDGVIIGELNRYNYGRVAFFKLTPKSTP